MYYLFFNMIFIKYVCVFLVTVYLCNAVKVNLRGSLHLGQEVMETILDYMKQKQLSARRSLSPIGDPEEIHKMVKSSEICDDIELCKGNMKEFLNSYLVLLDKTVETIFVSVLEAPFASENNNKDTPKPLIFNEEFQTCLEKIKKIVIESDKLPQEDKAYSWLNILKTTSIIFEQSALDFATKNFNNNVEHINEFEKKLTQKIVAAIVVAEVKYEKKLCKNYEVCQKSFECTKALNNLLKHFEMMPEAKLREFIKYIYEALAQTKFYTYVTDVTANELQMILSDMAFTENVSAKDVISTIQKTVQSRMDTISNIVTKSSKGIDTQLIYIILSDMDHFYSKHNPTLFYTFLRQIDDWLKKRKVNLKTEIGEIVKNLIDVLNSVPEEMFTKLVNEVKLFLEITVDPGE